MVPLHPPASCSAIIPVFCLSYLISFCHLWAGLFFPSSSYFFLPRSRLFIGALHFSRHVSPLCFYPSSCRSLNPLSFALLGPHPSRFSSCSPRAVSMWCPISTYSSLFPSFFLIHFLSAICSIHPWCHLSLPLDFLSPSYTCLSFSSFISLSPLHPC